MFDVAPTELLLIGAVAVAVIPPKDLPRAMRFAGQWIGKARGMARHFRSGIDEMIRQSELDEIEKKWREENERIMREHPLHDAIEHPDEPEELAALPAPAASDPVAGMIAEDVPAPLAAENGTELPPSVPAGNPASVDDLGPELPLGLPPKQ
ncbi:Sec-independent protein translocase protein TatB [Sphingomonas crusticola]|uniref:Sec-independent protein translocase protein TatB n=1 Tax=Sphingomonas crusticola TaxID=1697973 RepID=UPI001F083CA3|nr:Sec-independent protein translocase protein TatB [Sphingomonas crusticola]